MHTPRPRRPQVARRHPSLVPSECAQNGRRALSRWRRAARGAVVLLFLAVVASGCGSAAKTTLPEAWSANVGDASMVYVEPNREDVVVAEQKDIAIIEGASGRRVYGEREGFSLRRIIRESVEVGSLTLADLSAEGFSFAFLEQQGLVLVFDYTASDDIIRAIDLASGEEIWRQTGYRWSLQKYQAVGGQLTMAALRNVGFGAAVATGAVAAEMTRQRYTQLLVAPLPEEDAMLLKTVGALKKVDLTTGDEVWSVDGVEGSSLLHTQALPGGDILLLATYSSLLEGLSGGKDLIRLDPESGEIRWETSYRTSAGEIREVQVTDTHVLLVHTDGELEAYTLQSGERTLRTSTGWGLSQANVGPSDEDPVYLTAVPLVEDGVVYAARGRPNATGRGDVVVRAYDLASGEELWTSDPLERFDDLRDIVRVGDLIIGRGTNSGGSDGVVRSSLWGPDAYHRVAAWRIGDGSLAWTSDLDGGQTSMAAVDRRFGSYSRPAQLALAVDAGRLFTVSDTALVAFRAADGTPMGSAALPAETLDEPTLLIDHGEHLGVLHDGGMSFYEKSNLASGATSVVPFQNGVVSYQQAGPYLFAATQARLRESRKALHVVSLPEQRLVGTLNLESATPRAGNLLNGFAVTEGGRAVYVLDDEGTLRKYRVN